MSYRDTMTQQNQQGFELAFITEVTPPQYFIRTDVVPFQAYASITNIYTKEQTRYDMYQCMTNRLYQDGDYGVYMYIISDNDHKKLKDQLITFIARLGNQGWNIDHVAQYMANYKSTLDVTQYVFDRAGHGRVWQNTHLKFTINLR